MGCGAVIGEIHGLDHASINETSSSVLVTICHSITSCDGIVVFAVVVVFVVVFVIVAIVVFVVVFVVAVAVVVVFVFVVIVIVVIVVVDVVVVLVVVVVFVVVVVIVVVFVFVVSSVRWQAETSSKWSMSLSSGAGARQTNSNGVVQDDNPGRGQDRGTLVLETWVHARLPRLQRSAGRREKKRESRTTRSGWCNCSRACVRI